MNAQPRAPAPRHALAPAFGQHPAPCSNRGRTLLAGLGVLVLSLAPGPGVAAGLPPDVAAFVDRRDRCDHLRGEDAEETARRAAINRGLAKTCRGTDRELARLLRRHAGNAAVRDRLIGYDPNVEGASPRPR